MRPLVSHHRHNNHRRSNHTDTLTIRHLLFCLSILLLCVVYLYCNLPDASARKRMQSQALVRSAPAAARLYQDRIAFLLPFVGSGSQQQPEAVPAYLSAFCAGAAGASDVADFFLFHNGILNTNTMDCPSNVKFVDLKTTRAFAELLVRVVDHKQKQDLVYFQSKDQLVQLVTKHLQVYPYCLVEFKPALGYIFADYITGYSHWGYSDIDMLYGDLGRWITPSEMKDFDIVTYGFGDQKRLYLRGQFTLHKNTPKINQLWRGCEYLADLDVRLAAVMQGTEKYRFESAEGCYSAAVLKHDDIRIKYASKAWTDISEHDTAYSHGIYLARDQKQGRHVIFKATSRQKGSVLVGLSPTWFKHDRVYKDRSVELQKSVGVMEQLDLPHNTNANCMYWVQKKYQSQLCLDVHVGQDETVYWIDGQLYRQSHQNAELQTDVITGPFFHFQEWKRYYRASQLAPLHTSSTVPMFVLTREGAIPIAEASDRNHWSSLFSRTQLDVASPLQLSINRWSIVTNDRSFLPTRTYCLVSGPKKAPPKPPAPDCYFLTSWRDEDYVDILSNAPSWTSTSIDSDVTLVMTLQITKAQAHSIRALSDIVKLVAENLERWQGQPCVVVMYVFGVTEDAISFLRGRFAPESDLSVGTHNALIAAIYQEEAVTVSRKALLNMAIDAVPTRWYLSGLELERGLVMSIDSVYFAHRVLLTHGAGRGRVFIIPQLAREDSGSDVTLSGLVALKNDRKLKQPSDFDFPCAGEKPKHLGKQDVLWWTETEMILDSEGKDKSGLFSTRWKAELIDEIEIASMELLTGDHHLDMFAFDESPILLTDNLGPRIGLRTDELVREAEQLGGRRCYNGLRMAQMAAIGYEFDVLEGAFALSTDQSRSSMRWGHDETLVGASRCDGCFMFPEEHEEILESIIEDEIARAGKIAVLNS
jgi:hypothetical protein